MAKHNIALCFSFHHPLMLVPGEREARGMQVDKDFITLDSHLLKLLWVSKLQGPLSVKDRARNKGLGVCTWPGNSAYCCCYTMVLCGNSSQVLGIPSKNLDKTHRRGCTFIRDGKAVCSAEWENRLPAALRMEERGGFLYPPTHGLVFPQANRTLGPNLSKTHRSQI